MEKSLFTIIQEELIKNKLFVTEKDILKTEVMTAAMNLDPKLVKILLQSKRLKKHFFTEVEGVLIFDKDKFIKFVNNKQFLPDSYTRFKNKIGLTVNDNFLSENKEVVLSWPYKDCVLEGGMTKEDQKRDEVFYNEILAPEDIDRLLDPKVFTNFIRIDKDGEHKLEKFNRDENGTIKDNLIIKGNNLLALASLKKEFTGKVKLIYIDPPFNTGSDSFKYNDSFNHSSWLVFMKNRLEISKQLLTDDGCLFVHIDDNEQAYLKILLDSIFGRDNFRSQICWLRSSSGKTISRNLPSDIDYILWYSKTNSYTFNPVFKPLSDTTIAMYNKDDDDGRGKYRLFPLQKTGGPGPETTYDYIDNNGKKWKCPAKGWRMKFEKLKDLENNGRLYIDEKTIAEKAYWNERENEGKIANNLWDDIYNLQGANMEKIEFIGQKPEKLIKRIIEMTTNTEDVILDFHLGTGTTIAAAHKMKRQYIGIEQMNYINNIIKRMQKIVLGDQSGISKEENWKGGGEFIYMELSKWNDAWKEKIEKSKTGKELEKIWNDMKESAFLRYEIDPKKVDIITKEFSELKIEVQKRFLNECLDKNQLYINYSEIGDKDYKINEMDKKLNIEFYK